MFRTTIKFIKGYKRNTRMCFFGIAFSVMLMYSLIQMGDCLMEKFKELATTGSVRDFSVRNIDVKQAGQIADGFEQNKFSVTVEAYENLMSIGTINMDNDMIRPYLFAVEGNWKRFMTTDIIEGKEPENPYEICMEKSFAEKLGKNIKIGDKISLTIIEDSEGKEIKTTFTLTGFMSNTMAGSGSYYIITPYGTALDMIEKKTYKPGRESISIDVLMKEKDRLASNDATLAIEVMKLLKTDVKDFWKNYWKPNETKNEVYEERGSFAAVSNTFKGLAVFIAVCMVIFVFNAIYINVTEKIKQYGAMRCIGLSKKQLFRMILYEGAIYGIAGILAGIFFGNILNIIVAQKIIGAVLLAGGEIRLLQKPSTYLFTILLAFLSIATAMAKILWNMRKLTPVQALNYTETDHSRLKVKEENLKNAKAFVSVSAMRNIKRNLSKSVTLIITLTISTVLLMIIGNLVISIDGSDSSGKEKIADYEIYSETGNGKYMSPDDMKHIKSTDGVKTVYKESLQLDYQGILKETGEEGEPVSVQTIVYDNSLFGKLMEEHPDLEKTDYKKQPAAVLSVSPKFQGKEKEVTIKASKYVQKANKKAKKSTKIHLNGIIDENSYITGSGIDYYNKAYLIINEKMAEQMGIKIDNYSSALVKGESKSALKQRDLEEKFKGSKIICNDLSKGKEGSRKQLLGMAAVALYIVAAALLLSLLIINNTIRANILTRSKENGISRAIGMTAKQMRQIIIRENIILASWACVISFLIAVPINTYMTYVMKERIQPHLLVCVLVAALIILMCAFMAGRAVKRGMKQQIVDMIREE